MPLPRPPLAAVAVGFALGSGAVPAAALALAAAKTPAPLAAVVGEPSSDLVLPDDTLLDIAWRHRLGFERVTALNPGVDPWIPDPGTVVRLPTMHVLPDVPHKGIVVNVPELQLYDFSVDPDAPRVYAIAIGDEMDPSLVGEYRIGAKRANPTWHPPASIRAEKPELPDVVPPGPDNPLGPFWMTIGNTSYGIHGTNNRWSIGREATHGCIRLYNDEIAELFARTREGAPVRLIYQTVKLGEREGIIYLEAHPDRYRRDPDRLDDVMHRLTELGLADAVSVGAIAVVLQESRGEPVAVGRLPATDPQPATSTPTS